MVHRLSVWVVLVVVSAGMRVSALGGTKRVGDRANRFVVENLMNPQRPVDLYDYAGSILVIDSWTHWCPSCKSSMPKLQSEIEHYFEQRGGNSAGIPVRVISMSVDNSNLSAVRSFANTFGLAVVGLDDGSCSRQFLNGYIPNFTVINCVADSPSHSQWEVVFNNSGYRRDALRRAINSVKAAPVATPYEMWKNRMFSSAELGLSSVSGDTADPDADNVANLLEYAFGLNPKQADTTGLPGIQVQSGKPTLTYRHSKAAADLDLVVETSTNLLDGTWSSGGVVEVDRVDSNSYWAVSVQPVNGASKAGYMRVRAEQH